MNLQRKIKNAVRTWRNDGSQGLINLLEIKFRSLKEKRKYQKWVREFDALTGEDRRKIRRKIESFPRQPLISVILPVYNIDEKWLRLCIESVRRQLYANWELCIADDCSPSPHVRKILAEYAARDERVKVVFREKNGHISAASNSALELATGEFCVLLDHDDELAEHALYFVAEELNLFPETAMIYSDEDLIDSKGRRYEPKFKPDWSRDFICSLNLITHLSAYRTEILRRVGGFKIGAEGSQDYDLALRVTELISADRIRHIPQILYHWRAIQGSVALSGDEKPYAAERAREAIRAHLQRTGKKAQVSQTFHNLHRVSYDLPADLPKVSLIIAAKDEKNLPSLAAKTDYENLQFLSQTAAGQSSAAGFNHLAEISGGDILVFLDGDFEPQNSGWLKEIIGFARQAEIGAVGAKIINPNERIRHAGVVLGVDGFIGLAHRGLPKNSDGYLQRAQLVNNFSAVANVLATRREVFESLAGFDAENFPNGLFDVDFCLRLRAKNLRVVLTPYAEILQTSDSSTEKILNQKDAAEIEKFKTRWKDLIANDPFYNPNLSLENEKFEINFPPRVKKPWQD
ncbi:MAG TPA: glycosyltransferase [Pyrinomonadaceae bacterium]|jgi:GT2 family glycosyltransferase